jgi:tetratricopeptide (TPR) repeat protein
MAAYDYFNLPSDISCEPAVREFCEKLFDGAAKSMDPGEQEVVRLLPLLLEAELRAARLLAERTDFEFGGGYPVCGPTALAGTDFVSDFGDNCFILSIGNDDPLPLQASGNTELQRSLREIEQFFSSLRIAAAFMRRGEFERALDHLEKPTPFCFPLGNMKCCKEGPLAGCAGSGNRFLTCNPAFAYDDGGKDLQRRALDLRLVLLHKISEQHLKSEEPNLDKLKQLLRKTLEAAESCKRSDEVAQIIARLVINRVDPIFFEDSKREFVHALLEAAVAVCPHDDLKNKLALLITTMAIQSVRERDDYQTAADMLRKAYRLYPDQPRTRTNLIDALATLAGRVLETDDDLPPSLHGHYPASSLLWSSPNLTGASVLSASQISSVSGTVYAGAISWNPFAARGEIQSPRTTYGIRHHPLAHEY